MDSLTRRMINQYQHNLPLCERPYQRMAQSLGCTEDEVLARLDQLQSHGALSRVGPVYDHRRAGASTLAALAVPDTEVDAVAGWLNTLAEVNHNYLREHHFNLWFVLTGPDRPHLDRVIASIEAHTGLAVLDLPMEQAFRIDLGFPLDEPRYDPSDQREVNHGPD